VAKVLKVLGEQPMATGFLGGDRGEYLRVSLEEKGIEFDFVTVQARTRQCVTVIDKSAGMHTELVEESRPVAPANYDQLMTIIRRHIKSCRAIVMSGTITPDGPVDLYFHCTRMAHAAGALAVADAQGAALLEALKAGPGLVKPNRAELVATLGRELRDEAAVTRAMRELGERGAQRVIVTAGKDPALAFDGRSLWKIIPPRIKAVNPIGSGDAFTAGLVWRLLRGDDLGEACRWGSATGAANALTPMAGEVDRADVDRLAPEVEVRRI
jgi:tagatose 6-phosphate kinase